MSLIPSGDSFLFFGNPWFQYCTKLSTSSYLWKFYCAGKVKLLFVIYSHFEQCTNAKHIGNCMHFEKDTR